MIDKEQIDKLETLLGKVEERLWHMEQRLPDNQRKTFREQVREKMYDCSNTIVSRSEKYLQKEGF